MSRIYLAGPITGMTWDEANDWRMVVKLKLEPEVTCFSPLRAEHIPAYTTPMNYQDAALQDKVMLSARGILRRDYVDTQRADLLFANFTGAKIVSIGTVSELGWAYALRIPSVIVCPEGNIHHHPWLLEMVDWTVETLDEGISIVQKVLLPHYH